MKKLVMTQGLPGSGKTTWSLDQVKQHSVSPMLSSGELVASGSYCVRVNKDDIRRELEAKGWTWSPDAEQGVLKIRDKRIADAFRNGATIVISDDTNFARSHKVRLSQLAVEAGATFETKVFDTPIEECIRRDALREGKARVGEAVIRRMAEQYRLYQGGDKEPAKQTLFAGVVPNETLMSAIICDLDGTLSLFKDKGHRGPYDATLCDQDDCNHVVRKLLEVYYRFLNYQIIYLSGREDLYREPTMSFLRKHHCPPGPLHMRKAGDKRTDWIVKGELFDAHVRNRYDVKFVLDDRNSVVQFWRSIGLTCLQVAEGAF